MEVIAQKLYLIAQVDRRRTLNRRHLKYSGLALGSQLSQGDPGRLPATAGINQGHGDVV
jgi:hypothetical protein